VHRIGQPQSVNIYYLHVRGSVDDIMWSTLQTKLENVGQARVPAAPADQTCARAPEGARLGLEPASRSRGNGCVCRGRCLRNFTWRLGWRHGHAEAE